MIQGELVNGSVGQVVDFGTIQCALTNHIEIAKFDGSEAADSQNNFTAQNTAIRGDRIWPIVRFTKGQTVLIIPAKFAVNSANGQMEAFREQVSPNLFRLPNIGVDLLRI